MNYSGIINCTIVDGNGFRVALYISGCNHKCEGCHNKETWDFNFGKEYTHKVEEILFDRIDKPTLTGKLVYPVTDRFIVQWDEMKKVYPKSENLGSIF